MKKLIFNGEDNINIHYIFQKTQTHSDILVVSFPGAAGDIPGGEWGYLMTIMPFKVNALFIESDTTLNQSWLTYVNGKPVIENAVKALIDMCAAEVNAVRIIATGSSMGGFCSLYYGLKYGYDIIAGSLPYTLTDASKIMYAVGGAGKAETDWFNKKVCDAISEAGKRGFDKKIFISYGEGEPNWLSVNQGKKLVKDLENANIKFTLKLYPYSDHATVYRMFPSVLKARIGYYLGLNDEPQGDEEFVLSPEAGLSNTLRESYAPLVNALECLPYDIVPCTAIQGLAHYGEPNLATALRNFVYMEQGWYWGSGFKEPLKMPDKHAFWRALPKNKVAEGVGFWFQDTLLNFYEQKDEHKALEWCAENARQYLEYICRIADPKHNEHWWNSLRRMHFFIALHRDLNEKGISADWLKNIPDEIRRDIEFFIVPDVSVGDPQAQYRRALGLLHAAVYFRASEEFCGIFYNTALKIQNEITNFYFDVNGVCVALQLRGQSILTNQLMQNIKFIEENKLPHTKEFCVLKDKFDKIVEFSSHITSPDGTLAALGQSVYENDWWSRNWIDRKTGNYILRNSNIAILNDENNMAYITVNGGSNIHSDFKHCDLLSFTWWYDNVQVFVDSEGGKDILAEFAGSAIAHNGFIVDDLNYVVPSYTDFTTIYDVDERENCVILTLMHNCYEGVTLKRRLVWIKPNIIVLYDEAESETEHKYTQNFVMQNWTVDKKDISKVTISAAKKITASVLQIDADDNDYVLEMFCGTTNVNDEANYRGSLISGMTRLRKGCNLAYSKKGSVVKFLTAIELHGSSDGIAEQENRISSVKIDFDKLAVTLENGTEICENGLDELRNQMPERLTVQGEVAADTETFQKGIIPDVDNETKDVINGEVNKNNETD